MKTRRNFLKSVLGLAAVSAVAQPILAAFQPILAAANRIRFRAIFNKARVGKKEPGPAVRMFEIEKGMRERAEKLRIAVVFYGRYFNLDNAVIRLPFAEGNCPVGMADVEARINRECPWIEKIKGHDGRIVSAYTGGQKESDVVPINLNRPMNGIITELFEYPEYTKFSLSGTLIVACDIEHWKVIELLKTGEDLPYYFREHPICCAGRGKMLKGLPSASNVPAMADSIIKNVELDEYEGFGSKAVWWIDVVDLPAIFYVSDDGSSFFLMIKRHNIV